MIWTFIYGLAMARWLQIGGQVYIAELLGIVIVVFWFIGRNSVKERIGIPPWVVGFALLWAAGIFVSDELRGTPAVDQASGVVQVALLLTSTAAALILIRGDWSRAATLLMGYGIGSMIQSVLQPNPGVEVDEWKFGIGIGLTFLAVGVLALLPLGGRTKAVLLIALGGLHLLQGFRSEFLVCLIAAAVVLSLTLRLRPAVVVGVIVVSGALTSVAYGSLAQDGSLGRDAQEKYVAQSSSSLGQLGGRAEFIYSGTAIRLSPVVGIGSRDRDPGGVIAEGLKVRGRLGLTGNTGITTAGVVPLHSHALGSIARAGVLAAPFWVAVILLFVRALRSQSKLHRNAQVLVAFAIAQGGWDLMFSPLGAYARFQFAIALALALLATQKGITPSDQSGHAGLQPAQVHRGGDRERDRAGS